MAAEMTDAEFDDWIHRVNGDIADALDTVIDTESALKRVKATATSGHDFDEEP